MMYGHWAGKYIHQVVAEKETRQYLSGSMDVVSIIRGDDHLYY